MVLYTKYQLIYNIDDNEENTIIELKLKPIKNLLENFKAVYQPHVYINGFETNDYNDIIDGCVNTDYSIEEIAEKYKKELKKRLRKERKKFKLKKEKYG